LIRVGISAAKYINLSKEELKMYEEEKKARLDNAAAEAYVHAVGKAEGERAKTLELAKKMKMRGLSIADIVEDTGLRAEEISKL
jgi:predicted transposase/invertase (TIGR01784 family)